jgi:magnesium transporter
MIVALAHYVHGVRQDHGEMTVEQAAARPRSGGSFVWIDVHEPSAELMAELCRRFDLHELAVEDATRAHQRPKVEGYDDFYFIVFRTARYDEREEEVQFGELELFVGSGYIIAVRHGPTGDSGPVRRSLEQRPELLKSGPAAVVWGILDAVVDDYGPVAEGLERDIEAVEHAIFVHRQDSTERIYFLKREVSDFYRAVHPLLEPLVALERGAFEQIDPALRRYFRDVNDHARRVQEEVLAHRDQLTSALEANVSLLTVRQNDISARQNGVVTQLTVLASVFLPLTFLTGFFGQNFGWLVRHIDSFGAFLGLGVGGLAVASVFLLTWLRRGHYM